MRRDRFGGCAARRIRGHLPFAALLAIGGCADPYVIRLPLGFTGTIFPAGSCVPQRASGALAIDDRGRFRAMRLGRGELQCGAGSTQVEVERPASLEIELDNQPRARRGYYAYAHLLDAKGHVLSGDDRFEWSAVNAEIAAGTCGAVPWVGCRHDSTAATFTASAPSATISVRYPGLTATVTLAVREAEAASK